MTCWIMFKISSALGFSPLACCSTGALSSAFASGSDAGAGSFTSATGSVVTVVERIEPRVID